MFTEVTRAADGSFGAVRLEQPHHKRGERLVEVAATLGHRSEQEARDALLALLSQGPR